MMQQKTLANFSRGMDRQRLRATPKDGTFYNLLNCFITASGTIRKRPGFRKIGALDAGAKGLFSNDGALRCFYTGDVITPAEGLPVEYDGLQPAISGLSLTKVWADYLFLGRQYVAAEFSDSNVYHFWLPQNASDANSTAPTWKPDTVYNVGDSVQPSTPNGFVYVVQPGPNNDLPVWLAGQVHAIGDKIQPSVSNGYYETCTNTVGDNPKSGTVEPKWIASDGAVVYEDGTDTTASTPPPATNPPTDPGGGRYGNPGGGGGGGGGGLPRNGLPTKQL